MLITKKIMLIPTKEQELLFWKSAGTSRWAYNYHLGRNKENYENGGKYLKDTVTRKEITQLKKAEEYKWLNEVGSNVIKQAIKDCDKAFRDFFSNKKGYPKFKSKRKDTPSFYVNYESLSKKKKGFHGEKIGYVRTREPLPSIPKDAHYSNPHISYDGKYWYLTVGYEVKEENEKLTKESLGIDLGIKELAICSSNKRYKNINKTKRVKQLKKKLKRTQRKLSRQLKNNIESYTTYTNSKGQNCRKPNFKKPLRDCKNFNKTKRQIKLINRKINNIRTNYLHQTTSEIVKTKPYRIVLEDLQVTNMMKNKHLAKAIAEQKFYEFRKQIEYKAKLRGIAVVFADKFYPSSKTCSHCGHIKKDLKLSDRTYVCSECGLIIDRDYNASLNLANYIQ